MKNHEFIEKNIGNKVYVTGKGDLAMDSKLREIIFNKTELTIVKLTKNGMAYLVDDKNNYYSVPPRNVHEIETQYLEYGMCPSFTVWKNDGSCMEGHMIIKNSDTKEDISFKLIELITKLCKENNIEIEKTLNTINNNLKNNGLL